jgi:recombination DNA repair RAD52 pathway protein
MSVSQKQYEQLLKPINPTRVGKDGKGFSHLEAWDVRAHLIRIFGFTGWSSELVALEQVFETETQRDGKSRWTVAYRATVKLTIHDDWPKAIYTEAAIGDSQNNPSRADAHDMAIKTAESQAFKRCAVNLGDQFGLSLYKDGTTSAVVRDTLVKPEAVTDEPTIGTEQTSGTENPESE